MDRGSEVFGDEQEIDFAAGELSGLERMMQSRNCHDTCGIRGGGPSRRAVPVFGIALLQPGPPYKNSRCGVVEMLDVGLTIERPDVMGMAWVINLTNDRLAETEASHFSCSRRQSVAIESAFPRQIRLQSGQAKPGHRE